MTDIDSPPYSFIMVTFKIVFAQQKRNFDENKEFKCFAFATDIRDCHAGFATLRTLETPSSDIQTSRNTSIHVLKIIKSEVVKLCGGEEKAVLYTCILKTLMLWIYEQKPPEFWREENVETSVGELLCQMIEWLIGRCPNYLIPGNNMIGHLPKDSTICIMQIQAYRRSCIPLLLKTVPKAYYKSRTSIVIADNFIICTLLSYMHNIMGFWKQCDRSKVFQNRFQT